MSGAPWLEVRGLVVAYGGTTAVAGADLALPRGSLTALVGPSGCGKTSLLRAVAGFEPPREGRVSIGGEPVAGDGRWVPPERRRVGMVFQQGALFPHLTVWRNARFGVAGRPDADARAAEALERVGLSGVAHRYPDELSGGERQRLALARALAPAPRLILLDEPFASLDASLRVRLRDEVAAVLRAAGATALLVTHDQEEALSLADRVAVMIEGRILQCGPPADIYHRPASERVAGFVGGGSLLPCEVWDGLARTPFGTVPCDGPEGPARLFVRPEDFRLSLDGRPASGGEAPPGASGVLVGRSFFGHDVLDRVGLAGGGELEVRLLSSTLLPLGSPVQVSLAPRRFRAFPG